MNVLDMIYAAMITGAIGAVGWLMKQAFDGLNQKMDTHAEKLDETCASVSDMKLEMKGYEKLAEYQERRINSLEQKNDALIRSFGEIDKFIAVLQASHSAKKHS
jgi:hypothetical protein